MPRTSLAASSLAAAALVLTLGACTGSPDSHATTAATPTGATTAATPSSEQPAAPDAETPEPPVGPKEPAPTDETDTAQVTLVYVGVPEGSSSVQLSGVVSDLVEDAGTCTFVLRHGTDTVKAEQTGVADASSTSCGTVDVPLARLNTGIWEASLEYSGPGGSGTSAVSPVEIP